jgi:glycosyltransferase involved in cell wall biosynthesis
MYPEEGRRILEGESMKRPAHRRDPAGLAAAISRALAAPGQARSMAAAGREVCLRRFTEKAFVAGQLDIYGRVLAAKPGAPG